MAKFELYRSEANSEYRWRLKAANGKVIATSGEGYKNKGDCQHAIDVVKEQAGNADVDDQTG